jgi:hypothetical protein
MAFKENAFDRATRHDMVTIFPPFITAIVDRDWLRACDAASNSLVFPN